MTKITCAGDARDQLDLGLDLIRTAHSALYQADGLSEGDKLSVASTIEQAIKLFVSPAREWLDAQNDRDVEMGA